jgi:hypothetical protein
LIRRRFDARGVALKPDDYYFFSHVFSPQLQTCIIVNASIQMCHGGRSFGRAVIDITTQNQLDVFQWCGR